MGIVGNLWSWFKGYLSCRHQCVSINGQASGVLPVTLGVPQGSILGPLLFIIFINDMISLLSSATALMYADDTKCTQPVSCIGDSVKLQRDLDSLTHWSVNNLSFNLSKAILRFTSSSSPIIFDYYLNDSVIGNRDSCRDLGVIVSQDLSWSLHINTIVAKAYKMLGLIRRTFSSTHVPPYLSVKLSISLLCAHNSHTVLQSGSHILEGTYCF